MLDIEIMAEDHATVAQIRAQVEEIVVRRTDLTNPERHHLHIAARAGGRDRIFLEAAFVMDDAEHELRIESRARGLVIDRREELAALTLVGDPGRKPARHLGDPRHNIGSVSVVARHRIVGDRSCETRDNGRRELFLDLRAGERGRRADRKRPSRTYHECPAVSHYPISLCGPSLTPRRHCRPRRRLIQFIISASGTAVAALSRRPWYSTLPSLSARSPMVNRCGIPISSKSANITPGRSPRSSSSTSIPAAANSSCRRSAI